MRCHALLQGISLMQESTPRLLRFLHWQAGSLPLGSSGKPLENSVRLVVEPVATASVSHVSEAPNWGASLPLPHQAFTKPCLPPLWMPWRPQKNWEDPLKMGPSVVCFLFLLLKNIILLLLLGPRVGCPKVCLSGIVTIVIFLINFY